MTLHGSDVKRAGGTRLLHVGLLLTAVLAGCSWGPTHVMLDQVWWSPDGERLLIEHDDGYAVANLHGNVQPLVTWSELRHPQQSMQRVRYAVRMHWIDANTIAAVHHLPWAREGHPRFRLLRIDAGDPSQQMEQVFEIPALSSDDGENWRYTHITDVRSNDLVIGYGSAGSAMLQFVFDLETNEFVTFARSYNWYAECWSQAVDPSELVLYEQALAEL